ncbi:rloe protein [Dyella monticola]|uniref:Rloe protein n=1 Tax=Dyella monticola TaxID=1927958 RepID=A0A370WVR8_9GAMM|nr:DUF6037 family protein [Dyella monticola]RDS80151.1 rloe protein [Dyella monticola]
MRLTGLEPLYRSMQAQDMGRAKFRYTRNHLVFECLFFADTAPYELVMGCLGHNFVIFMEVSEDFEIKPYIEPKETFFALRNAVFQNAGNDHRLSVSDFFTEFNRHIPSHTTRREAVTADDVVRYYPSIEHANSRYFCGWRDNTIRDEQVTPKNLEKTRRLQGQRAHDFSLRRNQSTCWTHLQSKAIPFYIPD